MEDYYKVLGLKRGATLKEISAAYRSQALIYHPDKRKSSSPEDDEKFFKVKAAYQALQDPKIRAELDLHLIGLEERLKRDAQMSAQRKKMRDDLLNREREALNPKKPKEHQQETSATTFKTTKPTLKVDNPDACLSLKCKYPAGIDHNLALEMVKTSLNETVPLKIHQTEAFLVAEFKDSQTAYRSLCNLPNDLIVKADWYTGHPPDNLNIKITENTRKSDNKNAANENCSTLKYSKEMEESVLERLKRRKLEKQRESEQKD